MPVTPIRWTPELIDYMTTLRANGDSASRTAGAILEKFGIKFTRNAILGMANRLGLSRPRIAARNIVRAVTRINERAAQSMPHVEPIDEPDYSVTAVTLDGLKHHHCRWPLGDPSTPEFVYCGGERNGPKSYCKFHHRMAYRPARAR